MFRDTSSQICNWELFLRIPSGLILKPLVSKPTERRQWDLGTQKLWNYELSLYIQFLQFFRHTLELEGGGGGGEESVEYGQALFTPPYSDLFRKDFAWYDMPFYEEH